MIGAVPVYWTGTDDDINLPAAVVLISGDHLVRICVNDDHTATVFFFTLFTHRNLHQNYYAKPLCLLRYTRERFPCPHRWK
jgi:hypothetical protein